MGIFRLRCLPVSATFISPLLVDTGQQPGNQARGADPAEGSADEHMLAAIDRARQRLVKLRAQQEQAEEIQAAESAAAAAATAAAACAAGSPYLTAPSAAWPPPLKRIAVPQPTLLPTSTPQSLPGSQPHQPPPRQAAGEAAPPQPTQPESPQAPPDPTKSSEEPRRASSDTSDCPSRPRPRHSVEILGQDAQLVPLFSSGRYTATPNPLCAEFFLSSSLETASSLPRRGSRGFSQPAAERPSPAPQRGQQLDAGGPVRPPWGAEIPQAGLRDGFRETHYPQQPPGPSGRHLPPADPFGGDDAPPRRAPQPAGRFAGGGGRSGSAGGPWGSSGGSGSDRGGGSGGVRSGPKRKERDRDFEPSSRQAEQRPRRVGEFGTASRAGPQPEPREYRDPQPRRAAAATDDELFAVAAMAELQQHGHPVQPAGAPWLPASVGPGAAAFLGVRRTAAAATTATAGAVPGPVNQGEPVRRPRGRPVGSGLKINRVARMDTDPSLKKDCSKCGRVLQLSYFQQVKQGGRQIGDFRYNAWCRQCVSDYQMHWRRRKQSGQLTSAAAAGGSPEGPAAQGMPQASPASGAVQQPAQEWRGAAARGGFRSTRGRTRGRGTGRGRGRPRRDFAERDESPEESISSDDSSGSRRGHPAASPNPLRPSPRLRLSRSADQPSERSSERAFGEAAGRFAGGGRLQSSRSASAELGRARRAEHNELATGGVGFGSGLGRAAPGPAAGPGPVMGQEGRSLKVRLRRPLSDFPPGDLAPRESVVGFPGELGSAGRGGSAGGNAPPAAAPSSPAGGSGTSSDPSGSRGRSGSRGGLGEQSSGPSGSSDAGTSSSGGAAASTVQRLTETLAHLTPEALARLLAHPPEALAVALSSAVLGPGAPRVAAEPSQPASPSKASGASEGSGED